MSTGSLFNNMYGSSEPQQPEVGMGATRLMWSDRVACTIIDVARNGKLITIQEDEAIRTDSNGMSDAQSYEYKRDPNGSVGQYSLRSNGAYVRVGSPVKSGERLLVGVRRHYHDYTF